MLKKLLVTGAALAMVSSAALSAGAPYVGLGFGEQTNTSPSYSFRGMPFNLFAGYGADMGQGIYLAAEILVTPATAPIQNNGLKSTYNYGASFIPGIMISDHTMTYARLGVQEAHFIPSGATGSTVFGGMLGLGIETSLTQNWDLRGEYTFGAYKSVGGNSPRSDMATMGLVYKFE
jgi:opacity protein-like surface antigen